MMLFQLKDLYSNEGDWEIVMNNEWARKEAFMVPLQETILSLV
jgi:hypothetical protein